MRGVRSVERVDQRGADEVLDRALPPARRPEVVRRDLVAIDPNGDVDPKRHGAMRQYLRLGARPVPARGLFVERIAERDTGERVSLVGGLDNGTRSLEVLIPHPHDNGNGLVDLRALDEEGLKGLAPS